VRGARARAVVFGLAALVTLGIRTAAAQEPRPDRGAAPGVFLDCQADGCDTEHIRNEIRFVSWIRDRADADVHLLATSISTGGGGRSYRITTFGSGRFAGDSAEVRYTTGQGSTSAERRDELTQHIGVALVRYAALTEASTRIAIASREALGPGAAPVDDPWNHWVFSAALSAQIDGESRQQEREFEVSLQADRVTELWKTELEIEGEYSSERFELTDRVVTSIRRDIELDALLARAVADRWSAGVRADIGTSTFANQDLYARLAALVEYSFLPYADFSRRQITLQYSLGARHFDYELETIYDRLSEQRFDHQIALDLDFRQPWGSASARISGAHYLHDVARYNLNSRANLNVRLLRGLSIDVSARYERVRDQIYIPKGDASDEEVLLRRRALETGYRYSTSVGLRFTFGSIYSTVVNPRLD
jgi:hypothetical protein